jgi:transcriptional regulator with XRE-family HTH domain
LEAARVGAEVKRLRGKRSGQWLSERTAEIGHGLSRTLISELERGDRSYLSTTELTVLAKALNVAPVALLFPGPYDEDIEITPGARMSRIAAVEWFAGNTDPMSADYDTEFRRNMLDLMRARQIRELERSRRNLGEQLRIVDDAVPSSVRETLAEEYTRISNVLEELRIGYGG